MEYVEGSFVLRGCTDLGKLRLAKCREQLDNFPRARTLMSTADSIPAKPPEAAKSANELENTSPTKALDALVLGNTLVGYGDNISLENMMVIENIIRFSKLEADRETKGNSHPAAWHRALLNCMEDMGCFVPIQASVEYSKYGVTGTMKNIVTTIVKAGIEAAKKAIPGATALGAVADSTLSALEKEPETIKLFGYEVTKAKGVKLAMIPCDQTKNGLIVVSCSSINHDGNVNEGGVLFFDIKVSNLSIYQGSNFLTFNPIAYAEIKEDIEYALGVNRKEVLDKRFSRRSQPK